MALTDFFLALVDMSVAAGWVALAVMALRLALKKTPRWITVALWALVAVRLICPVTLESPVSLMHLESSREAVEDVLGSYSGPSSSYWDIHEEFQMAVDAGIEPIHGGDGNYYVITGETPTTPVGTVADHVAKWWVAGMIAMLVHAMTSYWQLRKKVAASLCLKDNIYLCDYIETPFILGVVFPKIYLPSSMDPGAAAHVLAHERAHLKRKDHWWKPLGFWLLTVHWFNPILWIAYVLLCRDIEMACDEKVIRDMAVPDKKAYSEALLRCSVSRRMIAACPLAFGEVGVKERVKTVLKFKKPAFWVVLLAVIALIVAAVCLLTDPVKDINGQRKFDLASGDVANLDTQEVMKQIRIYHGMEDTGNAYINDYTNDVILSDNFDFKLAHVLYFYYQDQKPHLSCAVFEGLSEECILMGVDEWEEQDTIYLLEHYLNALKYLPQTEIKAMLPNAEHYRVRFVEEGTPGSYDKVIRYSDRGVGATDGWLIHLEVIPTKHENGGFYDTGEPSVHLFYGDTPADVNGVVMDAKILEIKNKSYLVEPMPGSPELNSASQIWVKIAHVASSREPQIGEILRIVYDGSIMETYPAQLGEVFSMTVVTGEYFSEEVSWQGIYTFNDQASIGIQIPQGWEYERVNSAGEGDSLAIRFRPEGEEGWVSLNYQSDPFAVCGTGLETSEANLAGYEATQGFYDGRNIWSFIRILEELPGDYYILNEGDWLHNADYHATVWKMLETIQFDRIDQPEEPPETVSYLLNYANITVPRLDGWEYEIEQWRLNDTGNAHYAEIRFRPEEEQGWVALRYHEFLEVAMSEYEMLSQVVQSEYWGDYEVMVSHLENGGQWLYTRYVFFKEGRKYIPGTYLAINQGAGGWLAKETYWEQLMTILSSARLAEGILREDEALEIARAVSEGTKDMNYNVHYRTHTGEGVYWITFYDQSGESLWEVRVDNNGNIRRINNQDYSRIYQYEKEGFGGDFIIKLSGDGVAMYYEGGLSSYIGLGAWKQEGDFITITVEQKPYRFRLEENALVFIAEGSDSFTYIQVADGERFILQEG